MGYVYFTGNIYFVTCSTMQHINFFDTPDKKQLIKDRIREAQRKCRIKIYAYAILSNHYHILISSSHWCNVKRFFQLVNGGSSFALNRMDNIEGRRFVWDSRWAKLARNSRAFNKILGYILGNPYKHGLVKNFFELAQYPFCSYNAYVKRYSIVFVDDIVLHTIAIEINLEEESSFEQAKL